ncbi:hypothetical protein ABPG75_012395 [Micractinium tetrahymenae]
MLVLSEAARERSRLCRRRPTTPPPLPPLLILALLLACLCSPAAIAVLTPEHREAAFIGYSEQQQHGSKAAAEAAAASSQGEPCPADERPDDCPAWAKQGECLTNPLYMRAACKASCGVVARCVCGMAGSAAAAAAADAPWAGHATAAGTAAWAAASAGTSPSLFRQHAVRYSGLDAPAGSLTLSSLGIGTYLGGSNAETDELVTSAVIRTVAGHRWNVIDTAANYRWGRAEVSVGRALQALRTLGAATREQLFVATKAGYPPEGLLERLLAEGVITRADVAGGAHSMHPAYLQASLNHSLASLGLATVDLLYIHNPAESQLGRTGHEAFMQRLRAAFEWCERARAAGSIKAYGVATWSCFRVPPGDPQHLNLQSVVALAEEVGGPHHGFRYIQLPVSVGMPESYAEPWQALRRGGATEHVTLMQAAAQLGIGVFGSGPLMEAGLLKDRGLAKAVAAAPHLQGVQAAGHRAAAAAAGAQHARPAGVAGGAQVPRPCGGKRRAVTGATTGRGRVPSGLPGAACGGLAGKPTRSAAQQARRKHHCHRHSSLGHLSN